MSAQAENKALRERLIGTWRLIAAEREDLPSGKKTAFLGENPTGFLHYMPEGRMLALITRAGRKKPAALVANAVEAEALIRSMISYGARYECIGNEVHHHCDISWNESFTGTVQRRNVSFDGSRMTLSPPTSPDPTDGTVSLRRLVWEKLT